MLLPPLKCWTAVSGATLVVLISLIGTSNIINYYPEIPSTLYSDILPEGINRIQHRLFVHPDKNKNWWNHRFRFLKKNNLLEDPRINTGFGSAENSLSSKCKEFYSTPKEKIVDYKIWRFCSIGGTEIKTLKDKLPEDEKLLKISSEYDLSMIPSFTDNKTKWFWIMQDKLFFGFNGLGKDATDENWKNLYSEKRNYGDTKVRDKCIELIKSINSYKKYCYLANIDEEKK